MTISNIEPKSFTAGETVEWRKELYTYPSKDGWQLVYSFCSTDNKFEVTAISENNHYVIRLSCEQTSKYFLTTYWWQSRVSKEDTQYIIESGEL
ncbi:hypothetical protein N7281_01035 [Rickettsia hoogstraalii]|uniref:hypothetical protein n=1 Tax=Rickettsia hoogstraalii TaxID=467174 RepID=UPI002251F4A5|nr:hypothetical protein [Rickettsia hoogstraalii]MCX4083484.1 hypothetical protein [Rickettsia hoogstraalii]